MHTDIKHLFHAITTQSCEGKPRVTGFILLLVTVAQKFCLCPSLLWAFCGCAKLFNRQQSSLRKPSRLSSASHECRQRQTGSWGTATGNNMAEEFGCPAGIWFKDSCCKHSRAASRFPSRCADVRQKQRPLLSDGAGSQRRAFQSGGRSQVLNKRDSVLISTSAAFWLAASAQTPPHRDASPLWKVTVHLFSSLGMTNQPWAEWWMFAESSHSGSQRLASSVFCYSPITAQPCLFPLHSPEEIPQHIKLHFKLLKTHPHTQASTQQSCAPAGWSIDSENFKQLLVPVQKGLERKLLTLLFLLAHSQNPPGQKKKKKLHGALYLSARLTDSVSQTIKVKKKLPPSEVLSCVCDEGKHARRSLELIWCN